MRLPAALVAIIFFTFLTTEARAQEPIGPMSVEAVTPETQQKRTPMLVVHNLQPPPASAKPAATSQAAEQPANKKDAAGKTPSADAKPAALTQQPLVMPGARQDAAQSSYNMGTTGNPKYDELIAQAATRHGVDPNLVIAVMRQESGFNSRARSYKGATGLMQLMPATARRFGVTNIYDPAENIDAGTRYLRFLLDTFNGDVELALAGYNAGEGAVIKYGYTVPRYRETQNYVRSISAKYGSSRHKAGPSSRPVANAAPAAPSAITFSGNTSTRFSNNY